MTTYAISQTEWNVLNATSPETLVVINLAADSSKDLKPGKEIIVRPLYDKPCGNTIVREILSIEKYQSGIAATVVVSGFKLRDDISAYGALIHRYDPDGNGPDRVDLDALRFPKKGELAR